MSVQKELPQRIENDAILDDLLSTPTLAAIRALSRIDGDVIVLGVAGKMGPSLAAMVKRASDVAGVKRQIIGVSRFSSASAQDALEVQGIQTIRADLLDADQLSRLPDAPNVIYMAGMKFGSTNQEALTWAMNAYLPGMVCQKYRKSRIVAKFSMAIRQWFIAPVAGSARRIDRNRRAGSDRRLRHELPGP